MESDLLKSTENNMKSRIERFKSDMAAVRTGRANPQLLDSIKVEYYGQQVPIKQVAAITIPEARIMEIRPWDPSSLETIDKALQKSDLGIPPQNDGAAIRLQMPTMTTERRKDLIKTMGKTAEEARVALRSDRREAIEQAKKASKAKEISEDACKRLEEAVQKLTDSYIKKIDEALAQKEKEITTI